MIIGGSSYRFSHPTPPNIFARLAIQQLPMPMIGTRTTWPWMGYMIGELATSPEHARGLTSWLVICWTQGLAFSEIMRLMVKVLSTISYLLRSSSHQD